MVALDNDFAHAGERRGHARAIGLRADSAVLERRVSARIGDASDADATVVRQQGDPADDPDSWLQIDASGDEDDTCRQAQRLLSDPSDATDSNESHTRHD